MRAYMCVVFLGGGGVERGEEGGSDIMTKCIFDLMPAPNLKLPNCLPIHSENKNTPHLALEESDVKLTFLM